MDNIRTKIAGLDILLGWDRNESQRPENMLIVLRGERGISKVNLAMQMMNGISSCYGANRPLPKFYSLDKNMGDLETKYQRITGDTRNSDEILSQPEPEGQSYLYSKLLRFNAIMQEIDDMPEDSKLPCIVIDGFAGLGKREFNRLPMDSLEEMVRRKAHVGILVFDNRLTNFSTGADIVIEMRRSQNIQHNYTYSEIQIAKNLLSTVTNGWHNYRCDKDGKIIVYPSIHKLLDNMRPWRAQFENIKNGEGYSSGFNITSKQEISLADVQPGQGIITSIVGANNTFKRRLAAIFAAEALRRNERVFVILFNEMRRGFMDIFKTLYPEVEGNSNLGVLEMPMGCFSSEEFIDTVNQYIERFKRTDSDKVNLFMIDMAAWDYAFPMLQAETLLLPALTTICRQKKVGLTMVCNKRFSLVSEVCFVSDNVLCTQRESEDSPNALTLMLEKNAYGVAQNSRVYRFVVPNIRTISNLNELRAIAPEEISTTKDFWRQAWNVKNTIDINRERNEE